MRLFEIRKETLTFLAENVKSSEGLRCSFEDQDFQMCFALLTDISTHLNDLNLKLQGKNKNIFEMISSIDGFKQKLEILKNQISKNELNHFPCCQKIAIEFEGSNFEHFGRKLQD